MITGMPTSPWKRCSRPGKTAPEDEDGSGNTWFKGAMLLKEGLCRVFPAVKVAAKDTTGAGDAFIGSFAYYYALTGDIEQAVETANHYAALSTLNTGTQKAFYSREDFERERAASTKEG